MVYIERNPVEGQIIREIAEVSPVIERSAARPSFTPLFYRNPGAGLVATGNRPGRPGYRTSDLGLSPDTFHK